MRVSQAKYRAHITKETKRIKDHYEPLLKAAQKLGSQEYRVR